MSKVVRAIVGVGLIVAGVFMGGSTWPLAVMALGGGIAASALQPKFNMPSVSSATAGRLNKSLEPEAHRKIAYGRTALGTDTRYYEVFGPDQKNYHEVIALAGHKIQSFDALYVEDELVTFDGSGNAIGKYAGALSIAVSLEGVSGTALTGVGAGARWNVASGEAASMTGCAHMVLKWVWSQEKLPQGFPSRITPVGKGCLVYDPRRDSTRGGSGSHRAHDQSTWEYLPLDSNGEPIGRSGPLQILQYILGWYIWNPVAEEFVLAHGMGVHPEDIDFASFATAANECEAEGYYADCLLSTGDTHATNLAVLEQACAGVVSDVGGLYSLRIQVDDFGGSLVTFTDSDVVGDCDWRPEMPLSQQSYNQIAGQFIDPAALYQLRPMPLVRDAAYEAADGDKSRTNVRLDAVQDGEQGQKLLRLMLNQSRRKGMFEAPFGWRAVNAHAGQPVKLTLSRFGFAERYFRIRARKVDPGGAVWLALKDDGPSVYAGGTVLPVPPAAVGAGYDRLFVPTPSADDWTVTGGSIGNPGFVEGPVITLDGDVDDLTGVTHVLVDIRLSGETVWTHHGEFPLAGFEREQVLGLLPNATYDVRLRYRNAFGVIDQSATLIILDVVTGDQVVANALEVINIDGRPAEEFAALLDQAIDGADLNAITLLQEALDRFERVRETRNEAVNLFEVERTERIAADSAEATTRTTQISAVQSSVAAVQTEVETAASAIAAETATRTTQISAVNDSVASAFDQISTVAGEQTSQATAITNLSATVTSQGNTLSSTVTTVGNVSATLEERTAAYVIAAQAGAGFAGVGFFARDNGNNPTGDIRFASGLIGFGPTFAAPRFVIDMTNSEVFGLNAAGTVKTFQLALDVGRLRLRDASGALTYDSDNGGIQFIPPELLVAWAVTYPAFSASASGFAASGSVSGQMSAPAIGSQGVSPYTYEWMQLGQINGPVPTISSTTAQRPTFSATVSEGNPSGGAWQVKVTDDAGKVALATVSVALAWINLN